MQRTLGRSNIRVSAMGVGCWAIGGPWSTDGGPAGWGRVDDDESIQMLHAALDHGVTFFDTAANYGTGHSERMLARAFQGRRDDVIIATKFGYNIHDGERLVTDYEGETAVVDHLDADCEASLRRLNTDHIDLYQFHINGYDGERAAEVRDKLEELVAAGKIRFYGWSTDNPDSARIFAQGQHCVSIQNNMNVIHDDPEILAVCDEFNLASINRGPLAMGMLTGKYNRDSTWAANDVRTNEWFQSFFKEMVMDNLDAIRDILTSEGRSLAQGALAWLWGRSDHTIPIPGARTVAQVTENAGAMAFGPLRPEQMAEIDSLLGRANPAS